MTSKLSTVLWSSAGLLLTLFIAWYFSRKNVGAVSAANNTGDMPALNFGGTTINVPAVTLPTTTNPPPETTGCCKRCADSSNTSGGKVLQSGSFTQNTFAATGQAAVQKPLTQVTLATAGVPTGIELIAQENGGMPLPSTSWWQNDPTYRQAYVIAYNQTVSQIAQILMQQKRPAISQMPMSYANNPSPNAAVSLAEKDGATQLARGGHDTRWLVEAQNNSRLMMQTMGQTLGQWLSKLGDTNAPGSSTLNLPGDQNVSNFLIN